MKNTSQTLNYTHSKFVRSMANDEISLYTFFFFILSLQQSSSHIKSRKKSRMKWNWKCLKTIFLFNHSLIWVCIFFFCEYKKYNTINTFGVSSKEKKKKKNQEEKRRKSFFKFIVRSVENEEESALVKLNSTRQHRD